MQVDVNKAKTQLSKLLDLVERGETATITRNGKPVAELVQVCKRGLPFGIAGIRLCHLVTKGGSR